MMSPTPRYPCFSAFRKRAREHVTCRGHHLTYPGLARAILTETAFDRQKPDMSPITISPSPRCYQNECAQHLRENLPIEFSISEHIGEPAHQKSQGHVSKLLRHHSGTAFWIYREGHMIVH